MIEKLVINQTGYVYIRFKALIWQSDCLIQHSTVLLSSVKLLEQIYLTVDVSKPLVVSLKGVVDTERALEIFFDEIVSAQKRPLIFVHTESFGDNIIQSILRLPEDRRPTFEYDSLIIKVFCTVNEDETVKNLLSNINRAEKDLLHRAIRGCCKPVKHRLLSTVVSANLEFDAAKIVSDPNTFIWVCLFMADKLLDFIAANNKEGEEFDPNSENIKLLAVSLRASPFASALSFLIDRGYDTIDHLGPRHKLFDIELLENFKKGVKYIYVGDFAVGGTEIKIAKAYTELLGCELNYAIVLSSLLAPEIFKESFTLIPLTLVHEVMPDADYRLLDSKD